MTRVITFLIAVGILALGVAWLADRPGEVMVTWQGWRTETSVMMLAAAALAAMVVILIIWTLFRAILRSPWMLRGHLHRRRGERAYQAISRGLVAIGSGDLAAARAHAAEAKRMAPAEPLSLLLSAQHAQLSGDRAAAEDAFHAMASRADTKTLGLHGLFVEAQRRGDRDSAHAFAEEAARENPSLGWAGKAVLEKLCITGDWAGALALLERNKRVLDDESYRRQRAVMLTARALATEDTDRDTAKASALEAAKLAPTFAPAAALAGRMLAEGGELRKAARLVHKAWEAQPHPDLAQVFSDLRFGDAARDRLKRIEALVKKAPGHIESALALARAAIDAQEFAKARDALAAHLAAPTKRVALLMAELERAEHNDEGRVREWIARAVHAAPDPTWTADGHVSDRWLPASPSGRLDAFEWRVPLAGIGKPSNEKPAIGPDAAIAATPMLEQKTAAPVVEVESLPPSRRPPQSEPATSQHAKPEPAKPEHAKPEPVIPLVHAPDDPGPEAESIEDTVARVEAQAGGWRKMVE
ncbi:MAG TPA: heme biosynthesis HemY N-terminal domain-containing protein [Xanthobacteraceae bacterium]|nr:heme biosynthesis HemY N-terminal domain-containing protein [Xanthobacteraceae bacterium]